MIVAFHATNVSLNSVGSKILTHNNSKESPEKGGHVSGLLNVVGFVGGWILKAYLLRNMKR